MKCNFSIFRLTSVRPRNNVGRQSESSTFYFWYIGSSIDYIFFLQTQIVGGVVGAMMLLLGFTVGFFGKWAWRKLKTLVWGPPSAEAVVAKAEKALDAALSRLDQRGGNGGDMSVTMAVRN